VSAELGHDSLRHGMIAMPQLKRLGVLIGDRTERHCSTGRAKKDDVAS
jgi:hypothetical protein